MEGSEERTLRTGGAVMIAPLDIVEQILEMDEANLPLTQIATSLHISDSEVAFVIKYGRLPSRFLNWSEQESER